jgi:hypothetical protein
VGSIWVWPAFHRHPGTSADAPASHDAQGVACTDSPIGHGRELSCELLTDVIVDYPEPNL